MQSTETQRPSWLERPLTDYVKINWETLIFVVILILAVITRFYKLEPRVMSHDENSHVYFSWLLYKGNGYSHDPVTHGPLQFHMVALSYFLFGDNDTSARIPAVLFSIATVGFMWFYRRYLGRAGALIAAVLFLISPFMLYYGRYVRNEAFVALFGVLTIWAILRYFDVGQARYLLWLTAATVLHFTVKETSYIYTAQVLLFLAIFLIYRLVQREWPSPRGRTGFIWALIVGLLAPAAALTVRLIEKMVAQSAAEAAAVAVTALPPSPLKYVELALVGIGALAFLVALYLMVVGNAGPGHEKERNVFTGALAAVIVLLGLTFAYGYLLQDHANTIGLLTRLTPPQIDTGAPSTSGALPAQVYALFIPPVLIGFGLAAAGYFLMRLPAKIWPQGRERAFDMLIVIGSLVLPTLVAFLVKAMGSNPIDYTTRGIVVTGAALIPVVLLAAGIGLGWNVRLWVANAAVFYGIFVVFYTTIFTNGAGFFTGLVGSLGYWLEQQDVNRGTQPWYYYALVQIPVYEFLPALGCLIAAIWGLVELVRRLFARPTPPLEWSPASVPTMEAAVEGEPFAADETHHDDAAAPTLAESIAPKVFPIPATPATPAPVLALLGFWVVSSLFAFSYAGEKMPWLTVHITLPMLLLTGWLLGRLVETTPWVTLHHQRGWAVAAVLLVFFSSLMGILGPLVGNTPPFQGQSLAQLQATGIFITSLFTGLASFAGLFFLLKNWTAAQLGRLAAVLAFGFLAVLTARAAFMASYLNYDRATEYLVYAHCGPGIKEALAQIEDLSRRTTGDLSIVVAYDNETTYPYWWYLRNYSNQRFFGANPTREQLRDAPVILAGSANYSKVAPLVRQAYYEFEYVRIWWPDESYKGLTWQRIKEIVLQPEQRAAIFKIWLNRDYSAFAALNKRDMSLPNWSPADRFKLYVRKDIAAQLWNYGTVSVEGSTAVDPYDKKGIELVANRVVGGLAAGQAPGSFNTPRAVAVAPDGTLYVADTLNHRIQHLSEDGQTVLGVWGSFGASSGTVAAPNGSFNEPWGVAVAPDGAVYVADTWNNRIQKFTADGQFITTWGYGISQKLEDPYGFYGPRGVAVDAKGRVYVTDTGNKRVVVFDGEGTYVTQLGSGGYDVGQFDEPVGVAVSADGLVYVADTWNQRIQTFQISGDGAYLALRTWDVAAWYGNSIDNKPYITVDQRGNVYVTDPEAFRVLVFNSSGEIRFYWGDTGGGESNFGKFINGIAADNASGVWVVDSANNRLLHFMPPLP